MNPQARDFLARLNRERLLDAKKMRPLPHQAAVWAAFDGLELSDSSVECFPIETTAGVPDLALYYLTRSPIPEGFTDVLCWSGDEQVPEYRVERRRLTPRPVGPARYVSDLAAYKTGKSAQGGIFVAAELLVPEVLWDLIGMQYSICEPEFEYCAEMLFSETGLNLPLANRGRRFKPGNFPTLWGTYANSVGQNRMKITLSNGSILRGQSWESAEGMKGKERDGFLWAEAYQFGGIRPFTSLKQNLRARNGKSIWATTPDHPWVDILRELGESDDPDHAEWWNASNVHRSENPFTFSAREMRTDKGIMTREQHAISWEGKAGSYIGSVYEYNRGQRLFTHETHPHLFDIRATTLDAIELPPGYRVVGGGDTGTHRAAVWAAISDDDPPLWFFIAEVTNYRYVGTELERSSEQSMINFYDQVRQVAAKFGISPALYADPNAQFKKDWWNDGAIRLNKGMPHPEQRTERLRTLFQHDRVFIAPWMKILPYEIEIARYPDANSATHTDRREKGKDHALDAAEHIAAWDPKGHKIVPEKRQLAVEQWIGKPLKVAREGSPWI